MNISRSLSVTLSSALLLLFALSPVAQAASSSGKDDQGNKNALIISVQKLQALLQEQQDLVIIDVGWGGPEDSYNKGHIPGAIHVNTDEIEYDQFPARSGAELKNLGRSTTPEQDLAKGLSADEALPRNWWNIYPDHYLLPALANMGVGVGSRVVLYGKDPTAAARLAWVLLYAGVNDVRLLDGGLPTWKKAGFKISQEAAVRKPLQYFGADSALHPEYLVDISSVRQALSAHANFTLADVRTRNEYDGKSAPYSYIPTKGRIKDSVWAKAGKGPWSMDFYLNQDGTFRLPEDVERMWRELGITGDKQVAFYCGTGWRSSLAFLYAYMLGWERISNFDSGWYEWSMGPEADRNPMENFSK